MVGGNHGFRKLRTKFLCDGPGRIPVAGLAVFIRFARHTHKQALVALQNLKIVNYKAIVDFQAGKAHQAALRLDGPDGNIQLHRPSGRSLRFRGLPGCCFFIAHD